MMAPPRSANVSRLGKCSVFRYIRPTTNSDAQNYEVRAFQTCQGENDRCTPEAKRGQGGLGEDSEIKSGWLRLGGDSEIKSG